MENRASRVAWTCWSSNPTMGLYIQGCTIRRWWCDVMIFFLWSFGCQKPEMAVLWYKMCQEMAAAAAALCARMLTWIPLPILRPHMPVVAWAADSWAMAAAGGSWIADGLEPWSPLPQSTPLRLDSNVTAPPPPPAISPCCYVSPRALKLSRWTISS